MRSRTASARTTRGDIRLLVVDDHPVVRSGLRTVMDLQPGFRVVGEAADGQEAISLYTELMPDVTLMDLQMPRLDGARAIGRIRERDPAACVIVLTTYDTEDDIERALRAGAKGYLLKDARPDELVQAIRDVLAGVTRVAPAVATRLADRLTHVELTMRELTVLRRLAAGRSNKEISAELSIGEATVKTHVTHVFEKLGVKTRTEAIAAALKRGIVRMT